jgi:uncharacterized membrane protein YhfC
MAALTVAGSLLIWGVTLWAYTKTWRYLALIPFGLPLSAAVNLLVKRPIGEGVGQLAGIEPDMGLETPVWFLFFLFMLAPVFEELVKVAPLLIPWVRRHVTDPGSGFWTGMALGMGFGIGEALYLAWSISASGSFADVPWYQFTGFFGERLIVVFAHGVMTAVFVKLAAQGRFFRGYLYAVGLHAFLNVGAILFQLGLANEWIASGYLLVSVVVLAFVFEKARPKAPPPDLESGSADDSRGEVVYFHRG